jgi:hypothetical protein
VGIREHKRKLLITAVVAAVLVVIAVFGGCSSSSLPSAPTDAQIGLLERTHFKASVGVETYKYPVYTDGLIKDLRATGLFDRVEPLDQIDKPDLIARTERPVYGKATIPLWTIVTLGVVPTTVEEEHGHVFSLRRPDDPERSELVDYAYRGPTTLGWVAAFLNLSANRTSGNPIETRRFREGLALAIALRAEQIAKLLAARRLPNPSLNADVSHAGVAPTGVPPASSFR